MNQVSISVIIPVYNAEKFIAETIESVLHQSYNAVELVIVNDGSIDRSGSICEKYAKEYSNIKYYEKSNSGVSDTRNLGIEKATGNYITFLDSDDTLPEDSLKILVEAILNNNCDAVYANYYNEYDGKKVQRTLRIKPGKYTYGDLKDRILDDGTLAGILFGSACPACYKADFLRENKILFPSGIRVNEDGFFNLLVIQNCSSIAVSDAYVYNYRQWKMNQKKPLKKDDRFDDCEILINAFLSSCEDHETFAVQQKRRVVSIAFWNMLRIQSADASYKQCRAYLKEILQNEELKNCYQYLDYASMNRYKKVICFVMKHRMYMLFYVLIKYFFPVLSKVIKR